MWICFSGVAPSVSSGQAVPHESMSLFSSSTKTSAQSVPRVSYDWLLFYISNYWMHRLCECLSIRRAAKTLSHLSQQHLSNSYSRLLLALFNPLSLRDTRTLTAEVASVHHNVATASCGELCAILSHVSHSVQDAAFFFVSFCVATDWELLSCVTSLVITTKTPNWSN